MDQQTIAALSLGIPDEVRRRILLVFEDAVVDASGDFELFLAASMRIAQFVSDDANRFKRSYIKRLKEPAPYVQALLH
jgi:hypothetical protein